MVEAVGRRERKKAALRQVIADAALRLFMERGFDAVTISDVAEAADVARTTLFAHFPSKEALVFDREPEWKTQLVAAIANREPGTSIPQALLRAFQSSPLAARRQPGFESFLRMVESSPALVEYEARMWQRNEGVLAAAIAADLGVEVDDQPACQALARFMLDVFSLVRHHPDPERMADQMFRLIEDGWTATARTLQQSAPDVQLPGADPAR